MIIFIQKFCSNRGFSYSILPSEFVVALQLWLDIPVFSDANLPLCTCGQLVDHFGDHLIGGGQVHYAYDGIIHFVTLFTMLC